MRRPGEPRFSITVRKPTSGDLIQCRRCGYEGRLLDAHLRFHWYFLPVGFLLGCTIAGLIPLVLLVLYLGRLSWPSCPQCGAVTRLAAWKGPANAESAEIWRRALDNDRREFVRTKLSLLALLALVGSAVVVYLLMQVWF
jgi:Zn ribbon nucleic-acid-binding protein